MSELEKFILSFEHQEDEDAFRRLRNRINKKRREREAKKQEKLRDKEVKKQIENM